MDYLTVEAMKNIYEQELKQKLKYNEAYKLYKTSSNHKICVNLGFIKFCI